MTFKRTNLMYSLKLGGHLLSIVYKCRHCGHTIGSLKHQVLSTSSLGLDMISAQDKREMVTYKENGDVHIQAICEGCEAALYEHPHYYELDYFLQYINGTLLP